MRSIGLLFVPVLFLSGCAVHVTSFVREVRVTPDGAMHAEQCTLVQDRFVTSSAYVEGPCTWKRLTP